MGLFDRFTKRYERKREEQQRKSQLVSPDDPPIPDAPVEQAKSARATGRNDPCPCGSGKKYKKCCGKSS
jgi:uncharacterized protein YecA (UPF0149 family)